MFEQDYIMRQIQMLTQFVARAIFGRDKIEYETHEALSMGDADRLYMTVKARYGAGDVCGAENALFDGADAGNRQHLLIGLDFYEKLNEWSDDALEKANFSREEIAAGLRDFLAKFCVVVPEE